MKETEEIWDVIVIGGGPAGMMAAGTAGAEGAKVLLLEKNDSLGKKLLISGGGRCNVTNAEPDLRKLLSKFKDADKFLFSAFSEWDNKSTIEFFEGRGVPTKVENEQRVFPASNRSESIYNALIDYMKEGKVVVRSNSPVKGFIKEDALTAVKLADNSVIKAKNFILATGGKSRPDTGSTGDGFEWLRSLGHKVVDASAALVPIALKDPWISRLAGVSTEAKVTVLQNEEKQEVKKGKILFTHLGLSGPTILNLSKDIGELLKYGEVALSLDLLPAYDHGQLNEKLQELFKENINKKFKNSLGPLLPGALSTILVELSHIDPDKASNSVTREERLALIKLLKDVRVDVSHTLGVEKAVITSGGVVLEEVDFKTMRSRLYPNLYLVGDVLNIDRPTGGYGLQLSWTTGFVAGKNSARL
ncbi:MAG: flavoprotein [Parcubacteria group bacterium]|nr:flavoprotein [Parcubacteria group bacterium]